jgi:hypothetical protein
MEKQEFKFSGYGVVEKVAANGGNSARVFVPKAWAGKKVVAVLLEPVEGFSKKRELNDSLPPSFTYLPSLP